jgi:hypothetical protein
VGRFTKEFDQVRQQPVVSSTVSRGDETNAVPWHEVEISTSTTSQPTSEDKFKWGDESTVLQDQRAIAIYFNDNEDLVIREAHPWNDDQDGFVIIRKGNIDAFLDKLTDFCGVPTAGRS